MTSAVFLSMALDMPSGPEDVLALYVVRSLCTSSAVQGTSVIETW